MKCDGTVSLSSPQSPIRCWPISISDRITTEKVTVAFVPTTIGLHSLNGCRLHNRKFVEYLPLHLSKNLTEWHCKYKFRLNSVALNSTFIVSTVQMYNRSISELGKKRVIIRNPIFPDSKSKRGGVNILQLLWHVSWLSGASMVTNRKIVSRFGSRGVTCPFVSSMPRQRCRRYIIGGSAAAVTAACDAAAGGEVNVVSCSARQSTIVFTAVRCAPLLSLFGSPSPPVRQRCRHVYDIIDLDCSLSRSTFAPKHTVLDSCASSWQRSSAPPCTHSLTRECVRPVESYM